MKRVCSLLLGLALGGVVHSNADVLYDVTELNDTTGSTNLRGSSINNAGQVVGTGFQSLGQYATPYAFLYRDGQVSDMGSLGSATSLRYGAAINNAGQATGGSDRTSSADRHAFLYSNGQMIDLGALNGHPDYSFGNVISDNGQITGYASASSSGYHAFLYSNGTIEGLRFNRTRIRRHVRLVLCKRRRLPVRDC